jgi:hypothetical protein
MEAENMFKKVLSLALVVLVMNLVGMRHANGNPVQATGASQIEKIKENIRKLGTGPEARVEVKLQDNRKLKGYIREAGENNFVVVDEKTGAASTVDYAQVKQVKGSNRLTAAKVGFTIAKGVLVVAAVAAIFTLLVALVVPKT